MTAEDRPERPRASPLQAAVPLGLIVTGTSAAVSSSLWRGLLVGLIAGTSVYAVDRRQRGRRGG